MMRGLQGLCGSLLLLLWLRGMNGCKIFNKRESRKMQDLIEEVVDEIIESVIGLIIGFVALF